MKLLADIAGEKHEVRLRREGSSRILAEIDGRTVEVYAQETEAGGYLLTIGGRVYDCRVRSNSAQPDMTEVHVRNRAYMVAIADPKQLRSSGGAASHSEGATQIIAQMPGKIVRVHVEAGSQVEAGDAILVVEAMKMQNELKSPKSGTVLAINAKAGTTVNAGEVLAVIE